MSVAEVEMANELCSGELLALTAQMHQPDADTPKLSSHNLLPVYRNVPPDESAAQAVCVVLAHDGAEGDGHP